MSRPLSLFTKPQEDANTRIMKNLFSVQEPSDDNYRPLSQREHDLPTDPHQPIPKRPTSANPLKRRLKSAGGNNKLKNLPTTTTATIANNTSSSGNYHNNNNNNNNPIPQNNTIAREDLAAELYESKKKNLALEEQLSFLRTENQRLESEAMKQQRRIDQLLNLSEGVKSTTMTMNTQQHLRKEIEKSILVRQLKNQLNLLKNIITEKETENDLLKREMRSTHVREVETERDEYYLEIQRLLKVVDNLKGELARERRRREWNRKLAGETGDDLRKELSRLTNGYQTILSNLSNKNGVIANSTSNTATNLMNSNHGNNSFKGSANNGRPSTAGAGGRSSNEPTAERSSKPRPQSANGRTKEKPSVKNEIEPSPSEKWLESFNLETFENNSNYGTNKIDLLPTENTFNSKGKPLAEFANMNISNTPPAVTTTAPAAANRTNTTKKAAAEEEEDDEEEELPSEKIPVFDNRVQPAPVTHTVEVTSSNNNAFLHNYDNITDSTLQQYHTMDERDLFPKQQLIPLSQPQMPPITNPPKPIINHIMTTTGNAASVMPTDHPLSPGDRIQAEYRGKGRWYDGIVESFDKDHGTYTILYDDGEVENGVLPIRVRLISKKKPEPKFSSGNKIEALYYNGKTWYKGEVKGTGVYNDAKQTYQYEIMYLDGEREKNVFETNIRSIEPVDPPQPTSSLPSKQPSAAAAVVNVVPEPSMNKAEVVQQHDALLQSAKYKIGDKVEGCYSGNDEWYPASIIDVKIIDGEVIYTLLYENGDTETYAIEKCIRHRINNAVTDRPLSSSPNKTNTTNTTTKTTTEFKVNDIVETYFEEYENWFRGKIMTVNPPSSFNQDIPTYHVIYDDGDEEKTVPPNRIRLFQKYSGNFHFRYQMNDEVEARYRAGKDWYKGKIQACIKNEDYGPMYEIIYEDGDIESNVKESNISLLKSAIERVPAVPQTPPKATNLPSAAVKGVDGSGNEKQSLNPISGSGNKAHVVTTNLESFLNDLSDDDDEDGGGGTGGVGSLSYGLDAGKAVQLKSQQGLLVQETLANNGSQNEEEEYNEEDFDA